MLISTTIGGRNCAVLTYPVNWASPVAIRLQHKTKVVRGETGRENRYPTRSGPLLQMDWLTTLQDNDAQTLREALSTLGEDDLLAVPVWPDVLESPFADSYFTSAYWLSWDAAGNWVLNNPTYTYYAPLVFGRPGDFDTSALKKEAGDTKLTLQEGAPAGFELTPRAVTVGSDWPAGLTVDAGGELLETSLSGRDWERFGRTRELADLTPENVFRWGERLPFTLPDRASVSTLLNFWHNKEGRRGVFDIDKLYTPGTASPEAPHALRARFTSDDLNLNFHRREVATTELSFLQLPWELNPVAGEVPEQPAEARLFKVSYDIPGKAPVYLTDWDAPISYAAETWAPFRGELDSLDMDTSGKNMEASLRLYLATAAADPFLAFTKAGLEHLVNFHLYEGAPDGTGMRLRFVGNLRNYSGKGREKEAVFIAFGGVLRSKWPWFMKQRGCNHTFGDANCGVNLEAVKNTGTGDAADLADGGHSLIARSLTGTLTYPTAPDASAGDRWAGGLLIVGTGDNYQIRRIVKSSGTGSDRTMYFDRPLESALLTAAGSPAALTLYPECQGNAWECQNAWSNYANFGALPFMPDELEQPQGRNNAAMK